MERRFGSFTDNVDRDAFRGLPPQTLCDPATAEKNRAEREIPDNIYEPKSLLRQAAPVEGVPSITELARALKNDVDLIFQFVHDNIDFYPNYGLHKGGWGALVDGYGNAFDQSDLMVQLLTEAGYTASYVLGYVLLSASQWSNLLNIDTGNILYAASLFAQGGFSGTYNTFTNEISIDYCWVQCQIGGTNYQFDPATKSYDYVTGINLASAMGYSQSGFLSDAQDGATITSDYAQNINEPNISGNLTDYAMNLVDWISSNNSGASFNDILGGRSIVPVQGPVRDTTLPYRDTNYSTFIFSSLPNSVKATLQIQFGSINQTFYTNDIYGYRMSVFWNASDQAQLYLNLPGQSGNIVATTAAQTLGQSYPMTFTVTHPYASTFANNASTIPLTAGAYFAIGTAWGYAGRQMAEIHRVALSQSMNAGDSTTAENVIGESLSITWWNFSGQNTSGTQIINQLSNCFTTFHHNIGVVGFFPDTLFSPGNQILVNFFYNIWGTGALNPDANPHASSAHVALLWHLLESAIYMQTPGVPTTSAPNAINSANGGSCTATIGGSIIAGGVLNIFVHDSRLSTNPTQVSYTVVPGDTATTIASNIATAINNNSALNAIGVTATSSTNVVRIGSFSYSNTTFTQSSTGFTTITLASFPGSVIYGASKANWSTVESALSAGGYTSGRLQSLAAALATYTNATITGSVSGAGGDVLNIFVYDSGLATNPTHISYTTVSGDTTTSIATHLASAINASSTLAAIGVTATSSTNVVRLSSLSPNITTYTQSVTVGSEVITLPNLAFAAVNGAVASGGGDVVNIFVHNSALATNPTQISYTTTAGDTLNTIAANLATLINASSALSAIGVIAGNNFNILQLQSEAVNNTTYTASTTTGSETITLYYSSGYTATIPETAYVYVGNYFIGYGFYLHDSNGSVFFGPLNNTGKGATSGDISASGANNGCSSGSPAVGGTGTPSFSLHVSNEPIDLFQGRFLYTNTDIAVGNQSDPYQLSFVRSYNSGSPFNNDGLGLGWNHNYQISASVNSDGFIAFGYQSVSAAAAVIAEMYVCQDLLESTSPAVPVENVVTICIASQWLMNQMANNTAIVQFGSEYQVFAKLPDGSYVAPLGVKTSTILTQATTFTYTTPDKVVYAFNSSGKISSISYPFGITSNFTYTSGLLTQVSNGFRTLTLAYSGTKLSSVTDGNSRTVYYTIDSNNDLTAFEDPLTFVTTYSYGTPGLLHEIFRPANPTAAIVTNVYDTLGRVQQQTDAYSNTWNYYFAGSRSEEENPNGNSRVWYFDGFGNALQFIDQLGNVTTSEFDGLERVTLITMPEGNSTAFAYDEFGNVLTVTASPKPGSGLSDIVNTFTYDLDWNKVETGIDGNGNTTTHTYDATTGQLTEIEYPAVDAGTPHAYFSYNGIGQPLTATDPTGIITEFTYDPTSKDLLTQVVDSGSGQLNLTTTFTYDPVGNIDTIEDPNGNITSLTFDANRRLTQRTDPSPFGYITTYFYDDNNNLTEVQRQTATADEQIYTAEYTIDSLIDNITEPPINDEITPPDPTVYSYDNMRRVETITDSIGNVYTYAYDPVGRIYQITYPNSVISDTRTYTDNGYLETITDASSNETQYAYDGFDRLEATTYADATTEVNVYDDNNNVTQFTTRSTAAIDFTYDAMNQTLTKSPDSEATVTYTYDLAGRLTSASTPVVSGDLSTGDFQLFYDTAGRFYKEEYPDSKTVILGLDDSGNVTSITYPDSTVITRIYDELNRLNSVTDSLGSADFTYDPLSRRTDQEYGNGLEVAFSYDLSNNLLSLTINSPAVEFTYVYNAVHQEVGREVDDDAYLWEPSINHTITYGTANDVNQYPAVAGNIYSYSSNGNLTSDGIFTYTYDTENRLISATGPGLSASYKYDPLGRQATKTVNAVLTRFIYSGLQRIADYNGAGSILNRYIFGVSLDEPLWAESSSAVTYLTADETGSIILSTNSSGTVVSQTSYDPFGHSSSVDATNFGFTGQRFDPETGFYFYKARHYSPRIGRFLQNDPIGYTGGDLNLYGYVNNDPLNLFDPLGLAFTGAYWSSIMSRVSTAVGNVLNAVVSIFIQPASAAPSPAQKPQAAQSSQTTSSNSSPVTLKGSATTSVIIPMLPPDASLRENVQLAEMHPADYVWFYYQVRAGGPWDYKQRNSNLYEAGGNYNYGKTGAGASIPKWILLRAAGFAGQAATKGYWNLDTWLLPLGAPPYGDDRRDQIKIEQGYNDFGVR